MNVEKFGPFIASVRKERGMTQRELAEKIKLSDKTVSKWERGIGLPDVENLEPLAEALEISLVELMQSERIEKKQIDIREAEELLVESFAISRDKRLLKKGFGVVVLSFFAIIGLYMTYLLIREGMIVVYSVFSILLGLLAWGIPIGSVTVGKKRNAAVSLFTSLSSGMISVAIQIGQINHDVQNENISAIYDTAGALYLVAVVFVAITITLNALLLRQLD